MRRGLAIKAAGPPLKISASCASAYQEGREARRRREDYDNPKRVGTAEYTAYSEGWSWQCYLYWRARTKSSP